MPLTDTAVRNAKPTGKARKLADEKGLYLLIMPTGGKLWRFDYRFGGKRKTLALGAYPDVGLGAVRKKRDEARNRLADEIDPAKHRKDQAAAKKALSANSFEVVAREWFAKMKPEWVASHSKKILARFENDIFPWVGKRPIAELGAVELLDTLKRISDRGAKDTAKRAQENCGAVFRYAIQTGRTKYNPVPDLRGALPTAIDGHFAAITDPKQVGALLRAIEGFKGTFPVKCALKLSPYVFVRPGELRQAKWADIDLAKAEWSFWVSKRRKTEGPRLHLVPLAVQAVAILQELHALTGDGDFVFPGIRKNGRAMSESTVNAALRRMGYDTKTEITGHGFRAMARTILHEQLGVDTAVIEHQLAHKVPDALGDAYNRTKFLKQRRAMMQKWGDYLETLKVGTDPL